MRRPAFRRSTPALALFPFLAVLICTMGSLIVLLVLVLQQSRSQAAVAAAQEARAESAATERAERDADEAKRRRELLDDLVWRRETLEEQRRKQSEELAQSRLELSHLEDHIRRLQDQAKTLQEQLKNLGASTDEDRRRVTEELEKLQQQIAEAQRKLEEARLAASKKNKSFTIIPYEGRSGTRRRPIYIECAEEGIILHPEGVVFSPADFEGPLGPGNPLDSALRTVREYWARYGEPGKTGEPYPLLIVRPNGAVAYSMARAAMKSWDDEFGYELVDSEMPLQFPPSDPQLEQLLMRTLKDARHRQSALAAAMPSRYRGAASGDDSPAGPASPPPPAPDGRLGGPSGGGGTGLGGGVPGGGLPGASGLRAGGSNGFASGTGGPGGTGGTGASGTASGTGGGRFPNQGPGGSFASTGSGGTGPGGSGTGGAGGTGGTNSGGVAGGGSGGGGGAPGGVAGGSAASGTSGGTNGGPGAGGPSSGGAAGGGTFSTGGGVAPVSAAASTGPDGAAGSGGATGASRSSGGGARNGSSGGKFTLSGQGSGQRDGEWALPERPQQATAITRPIRVRCEPGRLLLLPERGDSRRAQVVQVPVGVGQSLDEFVAAVRKRMDDWGLAVLGGYWKPVLHVTVAPGAEAQFAELESRLRGSGIDVVRK